MQMVLYTAFSSYCYQFNLLKLLLGSLLFQMLIPRIFFVTYTYNYLGCFFIYSINFFLKLVLIANYFIYILSTSSSKHTGHSILCLQAQMPLKSRHKSITTFHTNNLLYISSIKRLFSHLLMVRSTCQWHLCLQTQEDISINDAHMCQ